MPEFPNAYIVKGNYLDPDGQPVIATRLPSPEDKNTMGDGRSWVGRWITACDPETVNGIFADEGGGLKWDHRRTRHVLPEGAWVVWDTEAYRVVPDDEFRATYADVAYEVPMSDGKEQ